MQDGVNRDAFSVQSWSWYGMFVDKKTAAKFLDI
jgi:hypothetical protein